MILILNLSVFTLLSLLYFTYKPIKNYKTYSKTITSLLFLFFCLFARLHTKGDFNYFILILTGLIFSIFGDIFLSINPKSHKKSSIIFLFGLISFSVTHIFYTSAFSYLDSIQLKELVLALLFSFIIMLYLKVYKKLEFNKLFIPSFIYCTLISIMYSKSLALLLRYKNNKGIILLVIGTTLFIISDFVLSFIIFDKNQTKTLPAINLITYYIGQFLIASTVMFL